MINQHLVSSSIIDEESAHISPAQSNITQQSTDSKQYRAAHISKQCTSQSPVKISQAQTNTIPESFPSQRFVPTVSITSANKCNTITVGYKTTKLMRICQDHFNMIVDQVCLESALPFVVELSEQEQCPELHQIRIQIAFIACQEELKTTQDKYLHKMKALLQLLIRIVAQLHQKPTNADSVLSLVKRFQNILPL